MIAPPAFSLRLLAVLAAASLAACATGAPWRDGRDATEAQLAEPLAAHARGDVEATLAALRPYVEREPWDIPAHRLRQDALRSAGRAEEAAAFYLAAASETPADARRALLAARVTTRVDGARLAAYRGALALDPEGAWPRAALAFELLRTASDLATEATARRDAGYPEEGATLDAHGEACLAEAAVLADEALGRDDGLAVAHAARASVLAARAEAAPAARPDLLALAVASQEAAVRLSPHDPRPLATLAALRRGAGDDAGAAAAYRAALALDPDEPALLAGLGRTLLDRGDAEAAAAALERAVAARPHDALLLLDLGVARQRNGDLDAAVETLQRAAALAPDDPRPLRALVLVVAELERATGTGAPER